MPIIIPPLAVASHYKFSHQPGLKIRCSECLDPQWTQTISSLPDGTVVPQYCFTWQTHSNTNNCNMKPKYCTYFECKSLICDYFTVHIKHPFKILDKKIIHHDIWKAEVSHRHEIQHYLNTNTALCAMLLPAATHPIWFIWPVSSQHLTMASLNNTFWGFTQQLYVTARAM